MRTSGQECLPNEEQIQTTRGTQKGTVDGGDHGGTQTGGGTKVHGWYLSVYDTQGEEVYIQGDVWKVL